MKSNTKLELTYRTKFLSALLTTIKEYQNDTHSARTNQCSLCILTKKEGISFFRNTYCNKCIYNQFATTTFPTMGCMCRYDRLMPYTSLYEQNNKRLKERMVAFHKAVYKWLLNKPLHHWTTTEIGKDPNFNHVLKIQTRILKKYP